MRYLGLLHITVFLLSLPITVCGQANLGQSIDCTEVSINFLDDMNLTREERISLMDKALFESLNTFELCQAANAMTGASSSSSSSSNGGGQGSESSEGGQEGQGGGAGESAENSGTGQGTKSIASSSLSGTEPAEETYPTEDGDEGFSNSHEMAGQGQVTTQNGGTGKNNLPSNNGRIPQDIPQAKNDDALAAQIRYAAENEPNPEKQARLWNEYRKYKGLPLK